MQSYELSKSTTLMKIVTTLKFYFKWKLHSTIIGGCFCFGGYILKIDLWIYYWVTIILKGLKSSTSSSIFWLFCPKNLTKNVGLLHCYVIVMYVSFKQQSNNVKLVSVYSKHWISWICLNWIFAYLWLISLTHLAQSNAYFPTLSRIFA